MSPIQIDKMSLPDRLAAMESLWASLQGKDREMGSPASHRSVLSERRKKLRSGKAVLYSLAEVRARLSPKFGPLTAQPAPRILSPC
jgi:hypothetical protein